MYKCAYCGKPAEKIVGVNEAVCDECIEEIYPLTARFPWLCARDCYTDEIIEGTSHYDLLPKGWQIAFGLDMIEEIDKLLKKYNFVEKYRILQVKEKWGELCWYTGAMPDDLYNEHEILLYKYIKLSTDVCIVCGKPATHMTKGWISYLCDEHFEQRRGSR
jgi:hypothetical protein